MLSPVVLFLYPRSRVEGSFSKMVGSLKFCISAQILEFRIVLWMFKGALPSEKEQRISDSSCCENREDQIHPRAASLGL